MAIIPLALVDLSGCRAAIGEAVSRVRFSLAQPALVELELKLLPGRSDRIAKLAAAAVIAADAALAARLVKAIGGPTASVLIADAYRNRLLGLLTANSALSRYAPTTPHMAACAYADALGVLLGELLYRRGNLALSELVESSHAATEQLPTAEPRRSAGPCVSWPAKEH